MLGTREGDSFGRCAFKYVWEQPGSCAYVCGEEGWGYYLFCVCFQTVCLSIFFFFLQDDAVLSLIGFPFHSLHASVSGQGIHHVCICLKSVWSTYWKVCIHLNILSLVCVQVIKELS